MTIIKVMGGLGNQMFQYAFGQALAARGQQVVYDITQFELQTQDSTTSNWEFALSLFPHLDVPILAPEKAQQLLYPALSLWKRAFRKLFHTQFSRIPTVHEPTQHGPDPSVLERRDVFFVGYWQSACYFSDIEEQVRNAFTFSPFTDSRNLEAAEQIASRQAVSVHIRRGDYLNHNEVYGNICTPQYYEQAIALLQKQVPQAHFYFFSDDPDWVREHFNLPCMTVVDWNTTASGYADMHLMSLCKHNIIANSSFSWWGAWLNANSEKTVVCPAYGEYHRELASLRRVEGWHYLT